MMKFPMRLLEDRIIALPDPEASGREYLPVIERLRPELMPSSVRGVAGKNAPLDEILLIGKRNLEWLDHMNSLRSGDRQLRLSRPGEGRGYPMEVPARYGEATILSDRARIAREIPSGMREVIFGGGPFTDNPPTDDEAYVLWAKQVDRLYQFAARWIGLQPWLGVLELRRRNDVRGYWYLKNLPDRESALKEFGSLPQEHKALIRSWLFGMCLNNFGTIDGRCHDRVRAAETAEDLSGFYRRMLPRSEAVWEEFFELWVVRRDVFWRQAGRAVVPFLHPENEAVLRFLGHIEDGWRWGDWRLILDFQRGQTDIPQVVFKPGVTPNVNEVGGNVITMDANSSLDEWAVQWTIRHEFGHVMGFPDCYLEFYVPEEEVIYNYQIDLTNLMCSRAGQLQEQHFSRLREAHFRP